MLYFFWKKKIIYMNILQPGVRYGVNMIRDLKRRHIY